MSLFPIIPPYLNWYLTIEIYGLDNLTLEYIRDKLQKTYHNFQKISVQVLHHSNILALISLFIIFKKRPVPVMVPPVPIAAANMSTQPRVSSHISGPVESK